MKLKTDQANEYFEAKVQLEKERKKLIIDREKMKDRVKKPVERLGLLHSWQMAFRSLRCCALPAMGVVAAAEDAMRYRKDLHVVLLDIRKAYDSVIRTIGKAAALRR